MNSNNLYPIKQESNRKRLERSLRAEKYNVPGDGAEGGHTYEKILDYCDANSDISYHLESINNLNLIDSGAEVDEYQHRDGVLVSALDRIKTIYEREGRIKWAGICQIRKGKHLILSGYNRNAFCKKSGIPFHFIVVDCTDRQAGIIAAMSNSEAIDTPAALNHSDKVKAATQQAARLIAEKNVSIPLSKKDRDSIQRALRFDMKQSFEHYTLDSSQKHLSAVINEALDAFTKVEDATRLTLKISLDDDKDKAMEQKREFVKTAYSQLFPDDPIEEGSYNGNRLQMISVSQWVNLLQRLNRYAYERETIGDEKVSKYGQVFSGNYKGGIHLAVGAYIQGGTATLTKKNIEDQRKEFLRKTKELNLNPQWFERDGRPKFERILFVSFFEGQDDVLYEWVNSKQDWIEA